MVVLFRRASLSAPFDYQAPRLRRLPQQQSVSTPPSHLLHTAISHPSPELLLAPHSQYTSAPVLLTPPPAQMTHQNPPAPSPFHSPPHFPTSEVYTSVAQSSAIGNAVMNNEHSFVPDDDDHPWIQSLSSVRDVFEARIQQLCVENATLKSENAALKSHLSTLKQNMSKVKRLQLQINSVIDATPLTQ